VTTFLRHTWFFSLLILFAACRQPGDAQSEIVSPTFQPPSPTASQLPSASQPPATAPIAQSSGQISPADPRIRYTGRIDFSDPAQPAFDWPAVTIEAAFEGTSLAILLEDGQNFYNVTVDGQETVLQTQPGQNRYVVASGLADGRHLFRMTKRTETFYGTPRFLGLELDGGRDLTTLPAAPERRIEFIGDSITAGYGSEGNSPTCSFSRATENVELTYAAMSARELGAAYTIVAVSGMGIVRNYNATGTSSPGTMLTYYDLTTTDPGSQNWDFQRWVPDAVVINVGTNDFSTNPHPADEVFLQGYTELMLKVRRSYPNAHIFALSGPIMVNPAESLIQTAVSQMHEIMQDDRVHFVKINNTLELSGADYGCDWHPNASGHRKIAEQLIPYFHQELNW